MHRLPVLGHVTPEFWKPFGEEDEPITMRLALRIVERGAFREKKK